MVFDSEYVLRYADGVVLGDRGYTPEQVVGCAAADAFTGWANLKPMFDRSLSGEPFVAEYEATDKRCYRMHGYPVLGPDGSVDGSLLVAHEAVSPAEQRLAQRLRQQAAIAEFGRMALAGKADLAELVCSAVRLVVETLPAVDAAGVGEVLLDGERFRSHGMGPHLGAREFPVAGSLSNASLTPTNQWCLQTTVGRRFPRTCATAAL